MTDEVIMREYIEKFEKKQDEKKFVSLKESL